MAVIYCKGTLGFMESYFNRCHGNAVKGGELCTIMSKCTELSQVIINLDIRTYLGFPYIKS
jgi:hypothetical protein